MELKAGYKNTEIGVIPEEWKVKRLGLITDVVGGGTPSTNNTAFWNGLVNWFTPTEIGKKKYVSNSIRKITEEGLKNSSARILPVGTILLTSRAGIGDLAILKKESCTNQGFQSLIVKENVKNEYLYYLMSISQSKLLEKASGSTFLEISPNNLKQIQIPLPPLPEQTAIATVLSDTDSLTQALEKKIAKKQLIKKGAMQVLLNPMDNEQMIMDNEQLTMDNGQMIMDNGQMTMDNGQMTMDNSQLSTVNCQLKKGWVVKTLGEVCDVRDGTHQTPNYQNTGVPFYSVESVSNNDFKNTKYISFSEHKFLTKNWKIEKGDILMTRIGSVGVCKYIDWDVDASFYVSLALLKPKNIISAKFLTQYSNSEMFKNEIDLNSLLFAIPKKINLGNISNVKLTIPLNYQEQTRIAQILSDMDSEIETLEKKLTKYKELKQGLMQVLLTGKIRLV